MITPAESTALFNCFIQKPSDLARIWLAARQSLADTDWPIAQQVRVAAVGVELARLAWQHQASGQPPALHARHFNGDDRATIHLDVAPLPVRRGEQPLAPSTPCDAAPCDAVPSALRDAVDGWHLLPVEGHDQHVTLRAVLHVPPDTGVPRPVDAGSLLAGHDFADTLLSLLRDRNLDMLELVHQLQRFRSEQEQLTREIEETNRGVVALYGELEDQARQLQQFNTTLEQRVAERTAEAEQRALQLRALASQLTQAKHAERRRIAQLLHDGLQQLIVASKMRLAMIHGQSRDSAMRQRLSEIDHLLNDMLQASRDLTIELAPPILFQSDLKAALEWLGSHMREKHNLAVTVSSEAEAPDLPEDLRSLVFQAAQELLFNVVKHAGTDAAEIRLDASDDTLTVAIIDRGRGFDLDSGHGHKPEKGTGFGLFSIRERLEWYGGRFAIDSTPGIGTTVVMSVPKAAWPVPDAPSAEPESSLPKSSPASAGDGPEPSDRICRVILADDHRLVREGLRTLVDSQPDMQVVAEASNGQEAVDLARQTSPHVILMDVNMPRLNGVEATRQVTERQPDVQVIALSMHDAESIAPAMKAAGAVAYVGKDVDPETLCETIRQTYATRFSRA